MTWAGRQFWAVAMVTGAPEASSAKVASASQEKFSSSMMRPLMTRLSVMPPMSVKSAAFRKNASSRTAAAARFVIDPVARTDISPGAAAHASARKRAASVSVSPGPAAPR